MGDGLGNQYHTIDKAYEDFAVIDGKFYKLGQTKITYDKDDYTKEHTFTISDSNNIFKGRYCNLTFKPLGTVKDGLNAVFLVFVQSLIYGHYNGECVIEGETFKLDNVLGTVEHMRARM